MAGAGGRRAGAAYGRGWRLPVSHDEQPEPEGQDELYAAFEALGGALTWDELTRLPGYTDRYRPALVQQARLLLDGNGAAAEQVVQASFAALQEAWRPGSATPGRCACPAAPGDREQVTVRPADPGTPGAGRGAFTACGRWCPAPRIRPGQRPGPGRGGRGAGRPARPGSARPSSCTPAWACPAGRPLR